MGRVVPSLIAQRIGYFQLLVIGVLDVLAIDSHGGVDGAGQGMNCSPTHSLPSMVLSIVPIVPILYDVSSCLYVIWVLSGCPAGVAVVADAALVEGGVGVVEPLNKGPAQAYQLVTIQFNNTCPESEVLAGAKHLCFASRLDPSLPGSNVGEGKGGAGSELPPQSLSLQKVP